MTDPHLPIDITPPTSAESMVRAFILLVFALVGVLAFAPALVMLCAGLGGWSVALILGIVLSLVSGIAFWIVLSQ